MRLQYLLAFDPDLHSLGWASGYVKDEQLEGITVGVTRVPSSIKGDDAVVAMSRAIRRQFAGEVWDQAQVVVEGQQIYRGTTPNPMSILNLGQVAGACLAVGDNDSPILARPTEWKKQVPKHVCQGRALRDLGVLRFFEKKGGKEPYMALKKGVECPFSSAEKLRTSDWKHVLDAVALLLWAARRMKLVVSR